MTTKAKHTPGPWTVEADGTTVSMGGQCVIMQPAPDGATQAEARANAALIAAAPALLAALRRAVNLTLDEEDVAHVAFLRIASVALESVEVTP